MLKTIKVSKLTVFLSPIFLALVSLSKLINNKQLIFISLGLAFITLFLISMKLINILLTKDTLKLGEMVVLPTYCMGMMMLSTFLIQFNFHVAHIIWSIFFCMHIVIMIVFTRYKFYTLKEEFIPGHMVMYLGIISASVSGSQFNQIIINEIILLIGTINFFFIFPKLLKYCFCNKKKEVIPFKMIMMAPFSLIYLGYNTNHILGEFPKNILTVLIILSTIYGWVLLFKLRKEKFNMNFASITFPLVINTTALNNLFFNSNSISIQKIFSIYKNAIILFVLLICLKYLKISFKNLYSKEKNGNTSSR